MSDTIFRAEFRYEWKAQGQRRMGDGLHRVGLDIHARAVAFAPVRTGALVNSGVVTMPTPLSVSVAFGGGSVPYAALREYVNNLHPATRMYLHRAGKTVLGHATTYFKEIV